jgi:excisionase family DNA binding protein
MTSTPVTDEGLPVAAYTVLQVARMFNMSRNTVYDRIKAREIPAQKIGRSYYIPARWVNKFNAQPD